MGGGGRVLQCSVVVMLVTIFGRVPFVIFVKVLYLGVFCVVIVLVLWGYSNGVGDRVVAGMVAY